MNRLLVLALVVGSTCTACKGPETRLNAPPHGEAEATTELQAPFVYMADNALLEDMSVSDYHFLPHRSELNTLGRQRLWRLATLMEEYGGDIRFDSDLSDPRMRADRTTAIIAQLSEYGVDTRTELVRDGMRGGSGRAADEVVLIKLVEGMYQPPRSSGGGGGGGGGGAGQTGSN